MKPTKKINAIEARIKPVLVLAFFCSGVIMWLNQ
jgi:hypothetical protein